MDPNGGFNYMTMTYATTAIPIALLLIIWAVWGLRRCVSSKETIARAAMFSQHVEASLLLSYVILPTVVGVQFKSLRCEEFEALGKRYLQADSSIDCDTGNAVVLGMGGNLGEGAVFVMHCDSLSTTPNFISSLAFCCVAEYRRFVGRVAWLLALYLCVPLVYLALLYRVSDRLHMPEGSAGDGIVNHSTRKIDEANLFLKKGE